MNRDKEWEFIESFELQHMEDKKSLLATMGLVVKELAIKCPNDQELGKEVRQLILNFNKKTNENN